jgi:hypothetical protein
MSKLVEFNGLDEQLFHLLDVNKKPIFKLYYVSGEPQGIHIREQMIIAA